MDTKKLGFTGAAVLLAGLSWATAARAEVYMDGAIGYSYYVAGVDADGFEFVDAEMYVEYVVNDSNRPAEYLSLSGWLTPDADPAGAGVEAGYLPLESVPAYSAVEVYDTVPADDVAPGEYHVHLLLQDDRFPGSFDDSAQLPPTLLWRGGLEAIGPLSLYQYGDGRLEVDFDRLDNNRIDNRFTGPIALTLFATWGFGPASEGVELCRVTVSGLYAGDSRYAPGFSCYPNDIPDGEYTLHLEVAEVGGRGGYSTLTGPDAEFYRGWIDEFHGCGSCFTHGSGVTYGVYYAAALGGWTFLPLLLIGGIRMRSTLQGTVVGACLALAMLPGAAQAVAPDPRADADYSQAELDQLLAPIALYPDSVLSHVMIAATYPLEVAQAARWLRQHEDLDADEALDAVALMDWDESVKALVAYPEILERMDEDLDWTQQLGEAFLAQEGDVLDRVQYLRQRADAAGYLESDEQVEVVREREVIYIEPAVRERIYVPYYDPWVVYGSWWWPAYPPHCWRYWGGYPVGYYHHHYHGAFFWGPWIHVRPRYYFAAFHWHDRRTVVVPYRNRTGHWATSRDIVRHGSAQHWSHDPRHRRHVEYRHERLAHRSDPVRVQRREQARRDSSLIKGSASALRESRQSRIERGRDPGERRNAARVESRLAERSAARVDRSRGAERFRDGPAPAPERRAVPESSRRGLDRTSGSRGNAYRGRPAGEVESRAAPPSGSTARRGGARAPDRPEAREEAPARGGRAVREERADPAESPRRGPRQRGGPEARSRR